MFVFPMAHRGRRVPNIFSRRLTETGCAHMTVRSVFSTRLNSRFLFASADNKFDTVRKAEKGVGDAVCTQPTTEETTSQNQTILSVLGWYSGKERGVRNDAHILSGRAQWKCQDVT